MLFRLVRPMLRKGSSNRYFVRRIPTDVKAKAVGLRLAIPVGDEVIPFIIKPRMQAVRLSLRTHDPAEVKARTAAVDAYLENVWAGLRDDTAVSLSHKQAVALAGELYRAWADGDGRERTIAVEEDPETGKWRRVYDGHDQEHDQWEAAARHMEGTEESGLEKTLGPLLDRLLLARGIRRVTPETRSMTLAAFRQALLDAFESRKRNAEGDYRPDPKSERFPEWSLPRTQAPSIVTVSLTGLVDAWWIEAKATGRKPSTHESYRNTMASFVAFVGHEDAGRVTRDDVVRFKDHRLASINRRTKRPISPKTVKDSDLAGLKTVFGWAVTNGKLASNPAAGVTIKLGKRRKVRDADFTDSEAVAILTAATRLKRKPRERPQTYAAKRWVPWLCAYTGARVGEVAQLRKEDVRRVGGHWVATITPEAGTVKTNEARDVVLHPHLVDLGFVEFVQAAPQGHLFLKPSRDGDVLGPLDTVTDRITELVRTVVVDANVMPNHGWRHRFKTVCRDVGIDVEVRDYIQGHRPRNVAGDYGRVSVRAQAAAIARMPRYSVT